MKSIALGLLLGVILSIGMCFHAGMHIVLADAGVVAPKEVITALFALVGAFFGALLSFEVARQKLVLEQLAANFAKFLESVEIAFRKATDVLYEQPEGVKRDIEIGDIYQSAQIQARVIRLYLSKHSKKEFWKLFREYRELHVQKSLGQERIGKMDEKLERIQEIFEEHLEPSFWHREIGNGFKSSK